MEKKEELKKVVRQKYGEISRSTGSCCSPQAGCCCNPSPLNENIGYSAADLAQIPREANLGLGCGNPLALASLKGGETVLDLGCGAGIDCFLAAARVGSAGKVIGVDMTPEMLEKARANAKKNGYTNVEFRLGEIENLPVADKCVDLVISNCVINLSTDKQRVFSEAFRVLKAGGRLMVSDIVLTRELPLSLQNSLEAYAGCIAGAMLKEAYLAAISAAGFTSVEVQNQLVFPIAGEGEGSFMDSLVVETGLKPAELKSLENAILSISVSAEKAL